MAFSLALSARFSLRMSARLLVVIVEIVGLEDGFEESILELEDVLEKLGFEDVLEKFRLEDDLEDVKVDSLWVCKATGRDSSLSYISTSLLAYKLGSREVDTRTRMLPLALGSRS